MSFNNAPVLRSQKFELFCLANKKVIQLLHNFYLKLVQHRQEIYIRELLSPMLNPRACVGKYVSYNCI